MNVQSLITDNTDFENVSFVSFHTFKSDADSFKILQNFRSYLQDSKDDKNNSPFKALLINGVCLIIANDRLDFNILQYCVNLNDTSYPEPSNLTLYVKKTHNFENHSKFASYVKFFQELRYAFKSRSGLPDLDCHDATFVVHPSMGSTPINWIQFQYRSSEDLILWQYRHKILFAYEDSPYRVILLGGIGYIFRKQDCPIHWKALCSGIGRKYMFVIDHSAINQNDKFEHYYKKPFELPWLNDKMLEPVLTETNIMEKLPEGVTGTFRLNGCSIVYQGSMNYV